MFLKAFPALTNDSQLILCKFGLSHRFYSSCHQDINCLVCTSFACIKNNSQPPWKVFPRPFPTFSPMKGHGRKEASLQVLLVNQANAFMKHCCQVWEQYPSPNMLKLEEPWRQSYSCGLSLYYRYTFLKSCSNTKIKFIIHANLSIKARCQRSRLQLQSMTRTKNDRQIIKIGP